jgi:hypothetical protein
MVTEEVPINNTLSLQVKKPDNGFFLKYTTPKRGCRKMCPTCILKATIKLSNEIKTAQLFLALVFFKVVAGTRA